MAKNTRNYWYNYVDVIRLLRQKSQGESGTLYHVSECTGQDIAQVVQTINRALEGLRRTPEVTATVIPINLGNVEGGVYKGSHWVGLAVRRILGADNWEAFYSDSLGRSMDASLPDLRVILHNHGILDSSITDSAVRQQYNSYDCGAWTVLNLDSLARTGRLPKATEQDIIAQRIKEFGYVHVDSASFERGTTRFDSREETKKGGDSSKGSIETVFSGHRGYGASQVQDQREDREFFPENSLISFKKVMEAGADSIEFDLYLSSDNYLMVIHDDDITINARHIVQRGGVMQKPGGGFFKAGDIVEIPPGKTFVTKISALALKRDFDISKGLQLSPTLPKEVQRLYREIPNIYEVLELVAAENVRRAELDVPLPRIKLNIELKGHNTGLFVQHVINEFNKSKSGNENAQINPEEIYYMSFWGEELAAIAGMEIQEINGKKKTAIAPNPNANLILGVPTNVQYSKVGPNYKIELPPTLNRPELQEKVERLHQDLKTLPKRGGKGLTGVDMSMWDVLDPSVEYFCGELGIPIHIAVAPYGRLNLKEKYVSPALPNIKKIAIAQEKYLTDNHIMIVKTDDPVLLNKIVGDLSIANELTEDFGFEEEMTIKKVCIRPATAQAIEGEGVEDAGGLTFYDKPITLRQKSEEEKKKEKEEALRKQKEEDSEKKEKFLKRDDDTSGQGLSSYENASYWNEYTYSSMKKVLELRLKSTGINIDYIKIIHPNYIFNEEGSLAFIKDLVVQVNTVYTGSGARPTLLIPININNQHWVGMVIEFTNDKIKITYMDSEAGPMPKPLNDGLKAALERSYPASTVEITEKEVEHQKYNNCGLEVIENLIAVIAGEKARVEQEEVLEFHSALYEQYLIEEALQETNYINTLPIGVSRELTQDLATKEVTKDTDEIAGDQKDGDKVVITSKQGTVGATPSNVSSANIEQEDLETMDKAWEQANGSKEVMKDKEPKAANLDKGELEAMNAAWNQAQAHGTESIPVKPSALQYLSSLPNIDPNDMISTMNSVANLLGRGAAGCGAQAHNALSSVPTHRLDTFSSGNSASTFERSIGKGTRRTYDEIEALLKQGQGIEHHQDSLLSGLFGELPLSSSTD